MADKNSFSIEALGSLTTAKIDLSNDSRTKINTEEKATSRYSIEYLKKMIKTSKLAENVTIQFSKDYPLKLSYKILDKMLMEFILAPRVQND